MTSSGPVLRDRLREVLRRARDGRLASDPGLLRARLAGRAVLAVALSSAVLHPLAPHLGQPSVVAMLLGGVVGLNGSFASSGRAPRDAARTLSAFPLAVTAGALPAALLAPVRPLSLTAFVVVMVGAVFVRRYGARWFNYGMLAWLSYFFATFLRVDLRGLPGLLAIVLVALACLVLVTCVVLPDRPERVRRAVRASFQARVAALARVAAQAVHGELTGEHARAALHARSFRLVEAALLLDGHLAGIESRRAATVRRRLLVAELAAEELAAAVERLDPAALPGPVRHGLRGALLALAADHVDLAAEQAREVRAGLDGLDDATAGAVRSTTAAVLRLTEVLTGPDVPAPEHLGPYEPAVDLFLGHLPGSGAAVGDVVARSRVPWSLNTRLCVQTAVAAPLAVLLGEALSAQRYYWAVLACFLVLTGTLTTGEATVKGLHRVVGTVGGLAVAPFAVRATGDHDLAVVGVMLVAVFLGLYFFRVSYAVMACAVTTVMGLLYEVLHEFSDDLLLLRLEETALGAGVAVAVVLLVLPVRTSRARDAALELFLQQLAVLLEEVAQRLRSPGRTSDLLLSARRLDARLHQVALVSLPQGGATLTGLGRPGAVRAVSGCTTAAYRARALVSEVAGLAPGSAPLLADRCDAVREQVLRAAGPRPDAADRETGPTGPPLGSGAGAADGTSEAARLLDELERAVRVLRPGHAPAVAAVPAG